MPGDLYIIHVQKLCRIVRRGGDFVHTIRRADGEILYAELCGGRGCTYDSEGGRGDSVYRIVRADFVHTNLEGDSVKTY